jgi:hypothetical protein
MEVPKGNASRSEKNVMLSTGEAPAFPSADHPSHETPSCDQSHSSTHVTLHAAPETHSTDSLTRVVHLSYL